MLVNYIYMFRKMPCQYLEAEDQRSIWIYGLNGCMDSTCIKFRSPSHGDTCGGWVGVICEQFNLVRYPLGHANVLVEEDICCH